MADKKKEEQTLAAVQAQAGAEGTANASDGYSAAGLNSRKDVEDALANASYKPGQSVTAAARALKEWQANRPKDYQRKYQEKIDQLVVDLVRRQHEKAVQLLTGDREKLDQLAQYLYEKETITGEEFMKILNG